MKKKNIGQRINNSFNAFFDETQDFGEIQLSYANNAQLAKNESEIAFTGKADNFVKILKAVFIFLPGAFFFYFTSIFFLYTFFVDKTSLLNFGFGGMFWILSALMIVFGIGDVKKLKSLLIPASISAISFSLFLISLLFPESGQVKFLFEYSVYLFPLVLIVPYLTNNLINRTNDKNSSEQE